MDLKNLIIVISLFLIMLLVLYILISMVTRISLKVKSNFEIKNTDRTKKQRISLMKVLDYKIQMHREEASNHEFDSTTTYNSKIKKGTKELNKDKIESNKFLSKNRNRMNNNG